MARILLAIAAFALSMLALAAGSPQPWHEAPWYEEANLGENSSEWKAWLAKQDFVDPALVAAKMADDSGAFPSPLQVNATISGAPLPQEKVRVIIMPRQGLESDSAGGRAQQV